MAEMPEPVYDEIGRRYVEVRRADPHIGAAIHEALGAARTIVNVGAGAGSYEPRDRWVLAVEPSMVMVRQRPPDSAPAVVARAEALPLADDSVDAAMAILSLHHWSDWRAGIAEMRRVARERVVLFTWDPAAAGLFWLTREYLAWLAEWDAGRFPEMGELREALPGAVVEPVPIPADCVDGFLAAFWARPEAYLEPAVQRGNSLMALGPDRARLRQALGRLRDDLRTGAWDARHGDLRSATSLDAGYRLVTARLP
jgi:SAM-dependent methyltransferase